jgi:hypothetical protein
MRIMDVCLPPRYVRAPAFPPPPSRCLLFPSDSPSSTELIRIKHPPLQKHPPPQRQNTNTKSTPPSKTPPPPETQGGRQKHPPPLPLPPLTSQVPC